MELTLSQQVLLKIILAFVIFQMLIKSGECVSLEADLTISSEERQILNQFRDLMEKRLPHEYMTKDIFLIRWLRARNFNINAAEQMLLKNLEWREKNKIDSILEEDFSDMEEDYKYYIDTYERDGITGVLMYGDVGNWDIRKGVLQGKMQRAIRYLDRYMEQITTKVRTLQETGHNITQYDFVMNMAQFNLIQHGCLQCISGLTVFILHYENYYPNACNKMYMVNTPATFEIILNAVKGALSPLTRASLQIYGSNKQQWQSKLFSEISPDYLPSAVGGNKILDD